MAYPTAAELAAESAVAALTSLTTAEQADIYAVSKAAIEEFCNQQFNAEAAATKVINGTGTDVLYLPKRLESISAFSADGSGLAVADLTIGPNFDVLGVESVANSVNSYYVRTLRDIDDPFVMKFPYGIANVSITGNWGWTSFPTPVRLALKKDMEDTALADSNALSDTVRTFRKLGLRDVSQGNLRASISLAPGLSDTVIGLLQPYIWNGPIGAIA